MHGHNRKNVRYALKYYLNVNKRRHLQFKYLDTYSSFVLVYKDVKLTEVKYNI